MQHTKTSDKLIYHQAGKKKWIGENAQPTG